jgi:hypothetical protein
VDAGAEAAECHREALILVLRRQYEEKKRKGPLLDEDEAHYQAIFAKDAALRAEPRLRYRFGQFYIEGGKRGSKQIKPNQAKSNHESDSTGSNLTPLDKNDNGARSEETVYS